MANRITLRCPQCGKYVKVRLGAIVFAHCVRLPALNQYRWVCPACMQVNRIPEREGRPLFGKLSCGTIGLIAPDEIYEVATGPAIDGDDVLDFMAEFSTACDQDTSVLEELYDDEELVADVQRTIKSKPTTGMTYPSPPTKVPIRHSPPITGKSNVDGSGNVGSWKWVNGRYTKTEGGGDESNGSKADPDETKEAKG